MDAREFLRLALDPIRLNVLGRAAEGAVDTAEIAAAHGVPERAVRIALGKLRGAGLIADDLRLDVAQLRDLASTLPQAAPADPGLVGDGWSEDEADVLGRFFSGNRLTSIPAGHAKRLVVLERLAQEFEPGLRYAEAEVNFTLQLFHGDYAALRRYLVDEGFLTRADGVYWRTGGRYFPGVGSADRPSDTPADAERAGLGTSESPPDA